MVVLFATLRALTLSVITFYTRLLFLFESVVENYKITTHSGGVKFGFLARFAGEGATFSAILARY